MKKLLIACVAAVMMASFASCAPKAPASDNGSSSAPEASSSVAANEEDQSSSKAEESSSDESGDTSLGTYETMEEYAASEEVQSQIAELKDTLADSGMEIAITGEGNKFIYTYTFAEGIPTDGMADSLKSGLEGQASTFESLAGLLKITVKVDSPVVVVRYVASDGTEVYSQEFEAK